MNGVQKEITKRLCFPLRSGQAFGAYCNAKAAQPWLLLVSLKGFGMSDTAFCVALPILPCSQASSLHSQMLTFSSFLGARDMFERETEAIGQGKTPIHKRHLPLRM